MGLPKFGFSRSSQSSFTLVELLIVIGILAVLSTATVVVLNPAELLAQSRDSSRLIDLQSLNKSINMFSIDGSGSQGSPNTVYLSLPDPNSDCSSYAGLPPLPLNWFYHCVAEANLRKIDATGWLPINFSAMTLGSPLARLPIDPVNSSTYYYTFTTGGSHKLTSLMEAQKHEAAITDGGSMPGVFEIGSDLNLEPKTGIWASSATGDLTRVMEPPLMTPRDKTTTAPWATIRAGCLLRAA
jgi:prepilin-type N-terminal cleavage/methylation domain-containing protein